MNIFNFFQKNVHRKKNTQGFTLVEVLVSLSIFTMVMLAMTGVMLTMIDANKKSRATQLVMDNLNFAIEDILRDIRVGSVYTGFTSNACISSRPIFSFRTSGNALVRFRCSSGRIERRVGSAWIPITAPEIIVRKLQFAAGSGSQPGVFLVVAGEARINKDLKSTFSLQTFVSQRKI